MSAGTTIADFPELLDYAQERYATAQDEEQEANAETQDILHSIEFQWYDPPQDGASDAEIERDSPEAADSERGP